MKLSDVHVATLESCSASPHNTSFSMSFTTLPLVVHFAPGSQEMKVVALLHLPIQAATKLLLMLLVLQPVGTLPPIFRHNSCFRQGDIVTKGL